tara:strand:+ start:335 stop:991 length:657 start_codon:yes stop_codon:yes gene_type:complete
MIKVTGVTKSYKNLTVLKGVDLEIKQGEIVSIVGASGAGKTTLLQIIGTLDNPDSGTISFLDTNISSLKKKELAKFRNKNIGFVFQFHHLLPEFTALENVCIPGYISDTPKSKVEKRAKELLTMLGLGDRISHKPAELSGGEQQRVSVARALINNPSVILADEPSGNLDSKNAEELHNLFFKLRDEYNQTFVIVTHNEILSNMSDRKLVMKDGVIINN